MRVADVCPSRFIFLDTVHESNRLPLKNELPGPWDQSSFQGSVFHPEQRVFPTPSAERAPGRCDGVSSASSGPRAPHSALRVHVTPASPRPSRGLWLGGRGVLGTKGRRPSLQSGAGRTSAFARTSLSAPRRHFCYCVLASLSFFIYFRFLMW